MPASPKPNKLSTLNNSRTRPTQRASTSPVPSVPSAAPPPSAYDGRCQHRRTDGKRCASPTYPGHLSLCHHHLSRQMRGISDGDIVAADILSSIGNFQSAAAINIALGKLFVHQITGRIGRQDALALAYNCQLLLQTLPEVKTEHRESGYIKAWREETNRILSGPSDLEALTVPSLLPQSSLPLHPPDRTPAPSSTPPISASLQTPATPSPSPTTPLNTAPSDDASHVTHENNNKEPLGATEICLQK